MNRRDLLRLGALAAGSLLPAGRGLAAGVRNATASSGRLVGAGLDRRWIDDPARLMLYRRDCAIVAPIEEMNWNVLRPGPERFDFTPADRFVDTARLNGWAVHGQSLITNAAMPDWLKVRITPATARRLLEEHVTTVASRYRGRIHSWNVVSAVMAPTRPGADPMAPGVWTDMLGPTYIDRAFLAAAAADPSARLVWNEHNLEHDTPDQEACRQATLNRLRTLKKRGIPIHALGLQSRLEADRPIGGPDFVRFLREVRALDLDIYITQLEVDDSRLAGTPAQHDAALAAIYHGYLDTVLSIADPPLVIFRQLSERHNWLGWVAKGTPIFQPDDSPHAPPSFDDALLDRRVQTAMRPGR
jgi:endo-1,4-beta-xylanase